MTKQRTKGRSVENKKRIQASLHKVSKLQNDREDPKEYDAERIQIKKESESEKELLKSEILKAYEAGNRSDKENSEPVYVSVNLKKLIEKVYVSPEAENWFTELVKSVLKKYNLNVEVVKSSLLDTPFF